MPMNLSCSQCGQVLPGEREGELCSACAAKFAVHLANLGEASTLEDQTMGGQAIAHYEVTGKLGAGGMGEVYRARDTKLGREVAIKILPDGMAKNSQVLSRFEREAKILATLNHPNIATIYGIEDVDGSKAIVMELVEGDTLGERLQKGAMSVEECLPVFRQIASALEAAHEKGIIHRDLKPGNIKFTADGQVKVLDFGLAKPTVEADEIDTEANTLLAETTMPGTVLGTPAYMSPEQTRGEAVDKRTDVWAFGCCLYECLTGCKPFKASTISDMMAEVLKSDPDFTIVPTETPNDILSLLRRCLEKEPRRRLRDIGDIAIRLEETTETSRMLPAAKGVPENPVTKSQRFNLYKLAAGLAVVALAVGIGVVLSSMWSRGPAPSSAPIRSIAIIPFENRKQDDNDWLAEEMTDMVWRKLWNIEDLVAKRGRIPFEVYAAAGKLESEIAAELEVDAIVVGSIVEHEGDYVVTSSLIRGNGGEAVPLEREEAAVDQPWNALVSRVALNIAEEVRSDLRDDQRNLIMLGKDIDPEAHAAYWKGLVAKDNQDISSSMAHFKEALEIEPNFLDVLVLNGPNVLHLGLSVEQPGKSLTPQEARNEARRWYQKAIAVNSNYARTYANRGLLEAANGAFVKADADLRTAEKLEPNNPVTNHARGSYLWNVEARYEDAIAALDRALAVDPHRLLLIRERAERDLSLGRYEEVLERTSSFPSSHWARSLEARAFWKLGELELAEQRAEETIRLSGRLPIGLSLLALIQIERGNQSGARILLEEMEAFAAKGSTNYDAPSIAFVYAALKEWEPAFHWLERVMDEKPGYAFFGAHTPETIELFGQQARYWELIDQEGFPELPIGHPFRDEEQKMRFGKGRIETGDTIESLAILPFEGIGLDEGRDLFATIMADEIHEKLQVLDGVKIVKDWIPLKKRLAEGKGPKDVASLLKVDALVTGVIVEAQGKLKITVNLHKADGSSEVLGNSSYHGTEDEIFEVQTEVALAVSQVLKRNLTEEEKDAIARTDTKNPDAYKAYLNAEQAMFTFTKEGFDLAETHARQALELDSGYGAPVSLLVALPGTRTIYERSPKTFRQGLEESQSILDEFKTNVRNKDTLKKAEGTLAMLEGQWQRAERLIREAAVEAPIYGGAYSQYLTLIEGDYLNALRWEDRALDAYPSDLGILLRKARTYHHMGNYDMSLEKIASILERHPKHVDTLALRFLCELELGKKGEAMKTIDRVLSLSDNPPLYRAFRAIGWARSGEPEKASEELSKLDKLAETEFIDQGWLAMIEGALGNLDKGIDRCEKLVEEGGFLILKLRTLPNIQVFGQEKRYWDLIEQLNFPQLEVNHPYYSLEQTMRYGKTPKREQK